MHVLYTFSKFTFIFRKVRYMQDRWFELSAYDNVCYVPQEPLLYANTLADAATERPQQCILFFFHRGMLVQTNIFHLFQQPGILFSWYVMIQYLSGLLSSKGKCKQKKRVATFTVLSLCVCLGSAFLRTVRMAAIFYSISLASAIWYRLVFPLPVFFLETQLHNFFILQ